MKAIILAAGYATRLYPLTENMPKPLLPLGEKVILEYILDDIKKIKEIDEIIIVTNHKFIRHFQEWKTGYFCSIPIFLLDDGTIANENRLGAIRDIQLVIDQKLLQDDILVLAGDNVFDFTLNDLITYFFSVNNDCIMIHEETNIEKLKKTGVAEISNDFTVVSFKEKPAEPNSFYAVPPFYIYKKETLPLFGKYLSEGNNSDAPGNFIEWLCKQKKVMAYHMNGRRYDIGDIVSYEEACKLFDE